jgi:WD40 repeat protein
MHPFGIFLTVGFASGFKVFAILTDGLFALKEVSLNNCRIVKYSNGGHFLITNEKSNIVMYDSIYYETLEVLDGHTAMIKDISISENDTYIVSTCMNGYVFCWNLTET